MDHTPKQISEFMTAKDTEKKGQKERTAFTGFLDLNGASNSLRSFVFDLRSNKVASEDPKVAARSKALSQSVQDLRTREEDIFKDPIIQKIVKQESSQTFASLPEAEAFTAKLIATVCETYSILQKLHSGKKTLAIARQSVNHPDVKHFLNEKSLAQTLSALPGFHHTDAELSSALKYRASHNTEVNNFVLDSIEKVAHAQPKENLLEVDDAHVTEADLDKGEQLLAEAQKRLTTAEQALANAKKAPELANLWRKAEANKTKSATPTGEIKSAVEGGEFQYNTVEAERLGLERLDLPAYPEADAIIEKVINNSIDINTTEGQAQFVTEWKAACPGLPMPCVPEKNDFWYLQKLASGKINTNIENPTEENTNTVAVPHYGSSQTILADSWVEQDWDKDSTLKTINSPILQSLFDADIRGVVNIKREVVDAKLWQGDPGNRVQTAKHTELITRLGLDPNEFEFHCITQDQYARGAVNKGWGQSNLVTNFDNYFLGGGGARDGLSGGDRAAGGASYVRYNWRDAARDILAFRLVLSRKQ